MCCVFSRKPLEQVSKYQSPNKNKRWDNSILSHPASKIMELGEDCSSAAPSLRKDKNKHKRFSDEQIRSLESMFESQTKLEPRVKMEMARELGLHPRQVAIWFQNRRARWKSKQIEQDYKVLKANYDNLHSQFETLKMEKQSLHIELQDLSNLLEKGCDRVDTTTDLNENQLFGGCHGRDGDLQLRNEPIDCLNQVDDGWVSSDGKDRENGPKLEHQEEDIQKMTCQEDGYEDLQEERSNVHSSGLLDESCGNVHWWDYWT